MRRGRGDSEQMERRERGWRGQVRGRAKGGEVRRSRGTRRRGSGRKRETIVRVSLVDQREMRIARLGWPLGRLSWGPNRVREVGRGPSLRLSSSSSFPPPLLRLLLLPLSRGDHRVFIMSVLCTLRSFLLSLSLSFAGRKWFMAVPERRFRRESCARRIDLYSFILRLHLLSRSCRFIRHASSLRPLRSRRVAVFLRGIPFFMHAIASFALLTRCNGISVFYRLDYYHHLLGVFSSLLAPSSCPALLCSLALSLPRRSFVTL